MEEWGIQSYFNYQEVDGILPLSGNNLLVTRNAHMDKKMIVV